MDLAGALLSLRFESCLIAFPAAVVLHVADEWLFGFPRWARRFGSPRYTERAYLRAHAAAIGGAVALAPLLSVAPRPWLVFAFVALWFGPGVTCNALFHVGASLRTRTLCAGALSGVLLYAPLSAALYAALLRDALLSPLALGVALALAAVVHTLEVGRNVFARW